MNTIFCGMLLLGIATAVLTGRISAVQEALLSGGSEAITLCLSMAGGYAFFGGLLQVLRESGAADVLAGGLSRVLSRLLPFAPGEEKAMGDICVNLSCNMLGMGSAATPAGIAAMKTMARAGTDPQRASDAMILFFVLNSSCIEVLPATMIALRAQYGAANPADVMLPVLLSTGASAITGVLICRLMAAKKEAGA